MARPLRIEYPGAFYHITTRGVGRQDIFFDEADKQMFLEKLGDVQEKWGLVVHGYCLMSNHYHLEVETLEGNISRSMQWLNHVYAGYINKKYKRVGHLFQGRFKSILIEAETHLHILTRYIHLNPVRAGSRWWGHILISDYNTDNKRQFYYLALLEILRKNVGKV